MVSKSDNSSSRPLAGAGKAIERRLHHVSRPVRDTIINRRLVTKEPRIALVRHVDGMPSYYKLFLSWMEEKLPEVRARFELRLLPYRISDWSRYGLVVPWITENVLFDMPKARNQLFQLVSDADYHGVAVINRPEPLLLASKYDAPWRMARLGVRTPEVTRITDIDRFRRDLNGLRPPLLVREEVGHNTQSPISFVASAEDARRIPLESYASPIAVEFIDVRDPRDGLVRKYRYMAIGDLGVSHSLYVADDWEVRGSTRVITESTRQEEIDFTSDADPNEQLFQSVRRGLGLDYVAFDYSYDRQGKVVVWEINVLPGLDLPRGPEEAHVGAPWERAMAATVMMYLQRAGIDVPQRVEELLDRSAAASKFTAEAAA